MDENLTFSTGGGNAVAFDFLNCSSTGFGIWSICHKRYGNTIQRNIVPGKITVQRNKEKFYKNVMRGEELKIQRKKRKKFLGCREENLKVHPG